MANEKGSYFLGTTLSFLIGTTTGLVLGVLFAPASGGETRKKIQEGTIKAGEKVKGSYEKVTSEAEKGIKVIGYKTQEGIDSIKKLFEGTKKEITKKLSAKPAKRKRSKK